MARQSDEQASLPSGTVASRDVARWCAVRGWPVHPLAAGRKTPAANCDSCRGSQHPPQKCPCHEQGRWCHGFHAATTNQERINEWWGAHPAFGVGVSCGPANLVVIDVDAHASQVPARGLLLPGIDIHPDVNLDGLTSGFDTLGLLAALRRQPNPVDDETTLRVRTPSGGLHIWYSNPDPQVRYRLSTGSGTKAALAWQVDIRADGGYIVAPSTRTGSGIYEPVGSTRRPAPLPEWLAHDLRRTGHTPTAQPKTELPRPRLARRRPAAAGRLLNSLLETLAACEVVPEGAGFSEKLNRAAYTAGGLVAGGHLTHAEARSLLLDIAHRARPHQYDRNISITEAGLAAGAQRPLHPQGRP